MLICLPHFRANFHAYCLFSLVNTIVYCIPAGWLWNSNGFLNRLGVVDIAGSGGVHLIGGSSGIYFYAKPFFNCDYINIPNVMCYIGVLNICFLFSLCSCMDVRAPFRKMES